MAVVGVAVGGSIVGVEAVGADPNDLVYVASITKPIVATPAMRLVSRRELELAAPLSVRQELTAAHVLTHTTGLPEVRWPDALAARPARPAAIEAATTSPLFFAPGTAMSYSTLAYELLAAEMASLTRLGLESLLRRELFAPLGMSSTTFDPGVRPADRGLGWRRGWADGHRLGPGDRVLEHDGAAGGCVWLDRDADMVVVFLTSTFDTTDGPWRRAVAAAYT